MVEFIVDARDDVLLLCGGAKRLWNVVWRSAFVYDANGVAGDQHGQPDIVDGFFSSIERNWQSWWRGDDGLVPVCSGEPRKL